MSGGSTAAKAIALSIGPAVGIGLARFGYAVLLPAMRTDLGWSYTQAGGMNTANALGYLAGALVAAPLAARMGAGGAFRRAILGTAATMLLSGATASFVPLLILRVLAGVGGAVALITGATLAARLVTGERQTAGVVVIGLYFGGVGMGILVMGLGLPVLLDATPSAWRHVWVGMGVLSLLVFGPASRVSRAVPSWPGRSGRTGRAPIVTAAMTPAVAAYFLFGLGYITYMTFVVAFLGEAAWTPWGVSGFWLVLGASTFVSGFAWPRLLPDAPAGRGLAIRLGVVAAGTAVPLLSSSVPGVLLSAVLFGGGFLSVVSSITEIIRRGLEPRAWSASIAFFTVVFSVGQTLGPLVSGALADAAGGLSAGLWLSAAVLSLAVAIAVLQAEVGDVPETLQDRPGSPA